MTLEEIRWHVGRIEASKRDFEKAHGMEDDLYADFIKYIASLKNCHGLPEMAKEVLKTQDINFVRYCA